MALLAKQKLFRRRSAGRQVNTVYVCDLEYVIESITMALY